MNVLVNADLGDIIYSLILHKALAKDNEEVGYYYGTSHPTATTHHSKKKDALYRLLEYQPYISSFGYCDYLAWVDHHNSSYNLRVDIHDIHFNKTKNEPKHIDFVPNLFWDPFLVANEESYKDEFKHVPLIELIRRRFNLEHSDYRDPWLFAPDIKMHDKKLIFNRTGRYFGTGAADIADFYKKLIDNVGAKNCGFVGFEEEYKTFCEAFGKIDHIKTKDLLDVACAIKNSEMFIGNQSSCMAIAEAMNHNTIQEVSWRVPNCIFDYRFNFFGVLSTKNSNLDADFVAISKINKDYDYVKFCNYYDDLEKELRFDLGNQTFKLKKVIL